MFRTRMVFPVVLLLCALVLSPARAGQAAPAATATATPTPSPARSEVEELKVEMEAMRARLNDLEAEQAAQDAAAKVQQKQLEATKLQQANAVTGGSFPGSFKLPDSQTSVRLSGFVDLQTFYDPNQYLGDKFQVGTILPNGPAQEQTQGTYHFQGKLTRINIESETPSAHLGPLRTFFSMDFFNSENGGSTGQQSIQNNNYTPRVREAWGDLAGFRIGKQWSLFEDDPDSMDSLDLSGPAGVPSEQVLEFRYTHSLGFGKLAFAFENPATDYAGSDSVNDVEMASPYNPVPDMVGRYEVGSALGHFQVSGVLRKLAYDDGLGDRSSATAGGGLIGGSVNVGPATSIGGQTWFGNGIQKFSPDDFGPVSSAQIDHINTPQQQLYTANSHGLAVYASHTFSSALRSNIGYGSYFMYWWSFLPACVCEPVNTHTIHVNTIWSPLKQTDIGVEYMHGVKDFRSSLNLPETGVSRLEAAFKYKY